MSDHCDYTDPADPNYPRGTVGVSETCESCGGRFDATAREAGTDGSGRPVLELESVECQSCVELGAKPPPCPVYDSPCGAPLHGNNGDNGPFFVCSSCDVEFSVATLRSLLFGRACEEALHIFVTRRGTGHLSFVEAHTDATAAIFTKARELKVIR